MKIYTKTGDTGMTSLIGGKRVPKSHVRIEAYGTVDELISYIGLLRDQITTKHIADVLLKIQDRLMVCASLLAADCEDCKQKLPALYSKDVDQLETEIDMMEKELNPLYAFILPGGHTTVSFCHIARNICRRAERIIIALSEQTEVEDLIIKYVNRLSDYLFVLSRKIGKDLNISEIQWKPGL